MSGFKAKQYPPQNGYYAVKVKNGAGWSGYSDARLQISVGQEYHEGEKLNATFNWVADRFDTVTVCVNDTLQRFNHMFTGMSEEEAYSKSESDGREWIERNQARWRHLPNIKIVRWDTWKNDPNFKDKLSEAKKRYDEDSSFRNEVDQEILSFWQRRLSSGDANKDDYERFKKLSKAYLLEEIAVFPIMSRNSSAVDIYPGSTLLPCKLNGISDLGQRGYTRIDFKRNNQGMPQVA